MLEFLKKLEEREAGRQNDAQPGLTRKILVVGRGDALDAEVKEYALNLAERLGYGLIVLHVDAGGQPKRRLFSPYRQYLRRRFEHRAGTAGEVFKAEAARKGISLEQVVKFGDLSKAVAEVNRQNKRIELVITQPGIEEEEVTREISLPVFNITGYQGERTMAKEADSRGSKGIVKTVAYGMATAGLYAAIFWHSDTVMQYFTKGAWYAALPIVTVFAISFVHGAFSHHLWEALGIHAPKRVEPRPAAAKRPAARKRPRPELRLNA